MAACLPNIVVHPARFPVAAVIVTFTMSAPHVGAKAFLALSIKGAWLGNNQL